MATFSFYTLYTRALYTGRTATDNHGNIQIHVVRTIKWRSHSLPRSYKQVDHLLVDFHGNAVLDKVARFNFYARHRGRCMLGDYPIRFWLFMIQQYDWLTPNTQRPPRSNNELFWVTLWNFSFEIEMLDLFIRPCSLLLIRTWQHGFVLCCAYGSFCMRTIKWRPC